jgi:N-acetylglucosamine kinase-like BadF-type ATPase
MGNYLLAVDGGGTKTEFCLFDVSSCSSRHFLSGASNNKIIGKGDDLSAFTEGITQMTKETGIDIADVRGLVMGMSGVDSPSDHDHYFNIGLTSGVPAEKIYVCNDSELAFYSEGTPPGLCIVAGTGSVSTGIAADGRKERSGGWGTPISDEGSGIWIGIKVLTKLLRYCDGYDEYQAVYDDLRAHFDARSFNELRNVLSRINVQETAATARLIMDRADGGDPYCADIVKSAARFTAELAYSVYVKLDFHEERSVDTVMSGSLFKSPLYNHTFTEEMRGKPNAGNITFHGGAANPVMGGITLAKKLFL